MQSRRIASRQQAALALVVCLACLPWPSNVVASQGTKPDPASQKPTSPPPTPPPTPSGQEVGGRLVITGDTVLVVADPDRPATDASIASKTDTPLAETPRSVSVTDRRTLDDRLAVNISDAHDYTASLMPADERGPAYSRGFSVSFYDLRRDGLRTYAWSVREPVAVERIQYLRGPAAILYGDGSPGGLINMVLRKPLPQQRGEFSASGGELGFARVTGDVTGPIGDTRRTRYRLIGAAEWLDNGFDNDERRLSLLPMLSFDINENATMTFDSEFYHQRGRNYRHTVPVTVDTQRGDFSTLPWELSVASPDEGWSGWNVSPGVRIDWQAKPSMSVHAALRYTRIGGDLNLEAPLSLAADGRTLNRINYAEDSTWQEWQSDTFVATKGKTGSVEHTFVAGIEAGLSTAVSQIGIGLSSPIDIYSTIYPPQPPTPTLAPTDYDVLRLGVYVQDQIRLFPALVIVPGLRLSRVDIDDAVARPSVPSAEQSSSDAKVSPSLGVVVQPRPWFSLYASAMRGFEPPGPGQYLEDGRALALADVTSYEGGVKWTPANGRVTATSAYYGIRRTNIPEVDALGLYRQIGEGESRGVELEFAGRLAAGLYAQAAYAWTDTEITESLIGGVGNDLPNAPHHNVSVWGRYRFTSGRMSGAMVAAGVVHVSDRFLAANNIAIAPSYTRLDLSASYDLQKQRVRLSVAVPNATNIRYATSGAGQVLWVGQPRRLVAQLSTWF